MIDDLARWTPGMSHAPDHGPIGPTPPAAAGTPPELLQMDDLLARSARRDLVPAGLVGRIFDASVGLLPSRRRAEVVRPRLEPVTVFSLWGRLALAAAIGLAFVVAVRLIPGGGSAPLLTPDVELVLLESATQRDYPWLALGFAEPRSEAVEQLILTRDMTFRDLASDLAGLAADLEM